MDRRHLLAILATGISGCATRTGDDNRTPTDGTATQATETSTDRPPVTDATRQEGGSEEWLHPSDLESQARPFVSFVVGNEDARPTGVEPHYVVVENQAAEERQIRVQVRDEDAADPAVDTTEQFPAGGILEIQLAEPSAFEVSVTVDGATTTVSVAESRFDCNDSTTGVYVREDGTVADGITATMMGCETPES
jgi:hypothetical protein